MKFQLFFSLLMASAIGVSSGISAQERLNQKQFDDYFDWFYQRSQINDLSTDQARLFIFSEIGQVRVLPCRESALLAEIPIGGWVENVVDEKEALPTDVVNGYSDNWYKVRVYDEGQSQIGYIWGGEIARGWTYTDLAGSGAEEMIMIGVSSRQRPGVNDFEAEIRVLYNGRLWQQEFIPGLCIFKDCAANPLLRVIRDTPHKGSIIIEASTLATGCATGIERAFLYWSGQRLERIWHAEMTTAEEMANRSFQYSIDTESDRKIFTCRYSHQTNQHDPVFDCQESSGKTTPSAGVPYRRTSRAR